MKSERKPLVSICCITYNHENYIRECIEGFLIQKTTFPIEIIIHDDASTDGTAEIVKEYAEKHPELIIPIFQKENQYSKGIKPIIHFVFPRARGKYIALCEGDDYWTDPLKLQKQVDFLEGNEEYVICAHDVWVKTNGALKEDFIIKKRFPKTTFNVFDLLIYGNQIHTPSVVFRNNLTDYPEQAIKSPLGDFFLWVWLTREGGLIKKLDEKMGVYRHGVGVFSHLGSKEIGELSREAYKQILEANLSPEINQTIISNFSRTLLFDEEFQKLILDGSDPFDNPAFLEKRITIKKLLTILIWKIKRITLSLFNT